MRILGALLLAAAAVAAQDLRLDVERPGDREFVRDLAGMLAPADAAAIQVQCDQLLTERAIPILTVTIPSMAGAGGSGLRIETFARLLFDQWGIGVSEEWNMGILLLVSEGDRKARIELGARWGRAKDDLCRRIMDEQIIPRFKAGEFSAGIRAGVDALDKMARGEPLPERPRPWWVWPVILLFVGLAIFTAVSLARRGASGWAWLFWAALFGFVGYMLVRGLSSRGGGGGFSGGSFGGGFSGGGGASGSW